MNPELHIAVIGMAGRFPGAADVEAFWRLLQQSKDAVTRFPDTVDRPRLPPTAPGRFVAATARLDDIDAFDHDFFGIHAREAAAMDPQHRLFLECAWHALEDAGHADPQRPLTGVFAACGPPAYLWSQCDGDAIAHLAWRTGAATLALNGNDPALLPLRTAYALDLHGPAINVQSACSSGLVAVAQACQSLAVHESDLCLAGAAHIMARDVDGYFYQRGGIHSADGRCRPFDRDATGTVFGDGVGVVVLRRLEDAVADGDRIDAVIRGWAVNNDGGGKASLSAPSARGQAAAVSTALALADVAPDTVGYVEAHGTGTAVGDTIELAGLAAAFGDTGAATCGIGSVKSHVGHLDVAAGIAGLVKTVLCLKHGRLAPSLHCDHPLPEFARPGYPFRVVREAADWPATGPRRAGVSSLGVGGTNCHVVLEDWRADKTTLDADTPHLLTLSATDPGALGELATRHAAWLARLDDGGFADACYTGHVGRAHFRWRIAVVASDPREAGARLRQALARIGNEPSSPDPAADEAAKDCLDALESQRSSRQACLDRLAALYETGADIDWQRLHRPGPGRRIAMPLYPFARSRHWMDGIIADGDDGAPTLLELPFSAEARLGASWRPDRPAYLAHHRLFGTVVAPASGQLSELLAAGRSLRDGAAFAFEDVRFLRPLVLEDGGEAEVQLVFPADARPGGLARLVANVDGTWREHTRAGIADDPDPGNPVADARPPAGATVRDGASFYRDDWAQGEDTGTAFRWLRTLQAGDGVATGRIAAPDNCPRARAPHPGVIEALFQLVYGCRTIETRDSVATSGQVLVPARIGRIAWNGAETSGEMTGLARIRDMQPDASSVIADLALFDDRGDVVLSVQSFELRALARQALSTAPRPGVVTRRWHPVPVGDAAAAAGHTTVLGTGPLANALADRLGTSAPAAAPGAPSETFACLWPLAVRFDPDRDAPRASLEPLLGSLYALLQRRGRRAPGPRIVVVTRNAIDVPGQSAPCDPMQSAVRGFVRVAAREYPGCSIRLVDVEDEDEATAGALAFELGLEAGADDVAYRQGIRYAASLQSVRLDGTGKAPATAYVVAGDGGERDRWLARRLARCGTDAECCRLEAAPARLSARPGTGLVVSTGAPRDALIDAAPWADFAERLSASLDELVAMHRASHQCADLVLLTPGSAWTGNTGQAAYAASGAFAEGLAAYRRAVGLPGRTLAYGPWADAGDWTRLDQRRRQRLLVDGFTPVATEDALAIFGRFVVGALEAACVPCRATDGVAGPVTRSSVTPPNPDSGVDAPGEPVGDIESHLRDLLAAQLGIEPGRIDPGRPLRELGIDSLDAVGLGDAIETSLGVETTIGDIVDAASLRALGRRLVDRAAATAAPPVAEDDETVLVRLRAGRGQPVFCVPADSGTALSLKPLADAMGIDRPLYAFQAPGVDDGEATPQTIDALAGRYQDALRRVQPTGPYTLVGRCSGGLAAYQLALRLAAAGERIDSLVLIDTLPPGAVATDPVLAARQARIDDAVRDRIGSLPPLARERFTRVQAALDRAVADFEPAAVFDGRLVVARATQDRHPLQDEWRRFSAGGVEFVDVPGDHRTLFEPPALSRLAAAVADVLAAGTSR